MANFIVIGKPRGGKTLISVARIRERLLAGCRVATNLNLNLEHMLPLSTRQVSCIRLPDFPSVQDFEALGFGSDAYADESKFGLIVLDETSAFFNARTWADKSRQAVIDWLKHSGKLRWDIYFIAQSESMIDKQIREAFGEHLVVCRRLDRLPLPFVGWLFKLFGLPIKFPKAHLGVVRYGLAKSDLVVARWLYRGRDLYKAYDTEQIFNADTSPAIYSLLPPYTLKGRFMSPFSIARLMVVGAASLAFVCGVVMTATFTYFSNTLRPAIASKVSSSVYVSSYAIADGVAHVNLSDGRSIQSKTYAVSNSGFSVNHTAGLFSTKE